VGWLVCGHKGERGEWEGEKDEGDKCYGACAVFVGYVAFNSVRTVSFSCTWESWGEKMLGKMEGRVCYRKKARRGQSGQTGGRPDLRLVGSS
jgi:hypothetical protein